MIGAARRAGDVLVALRDVHRLYGEGDALVKALDGIDLDVREGEFLALMGPSGSGKSTCLNILGCLDVPTKGSYRFRDVEVTELDENQRALLRRHYLGFVFQGFNLLPRTTALENVELPLVYRGISSRDRHDLARKALDDVGLGNRLDHTPAQLSGGQQQRVAIARALVTEPLLLFADEPTGNLDSTTSHDVMKLMRDLNERRGLTIAMVTHEPDMAAYSHRTLHFRDGRILEPVAS